MRTSSLLLALVILGASACSRHRASEAECNELVDRLVALELRQAGFRDHVLEKARGAELRKRLAANTSQCRNLELSPGVLVCAQRARTTEELAHKCLR